MLRPALATILLLIGCQPRVLLGQTPWDELLAAAGLTPDSAQLPRNRWVGGGQFRLKSFQRLWDDWRLIGRAASELAKEMSSESPRFEEFLRLSARQIGVAVPPDASKHQPAAARESTGHDGLVRAVSELHACLGNALTDAEELSLRERSRGVPPQVSTGAAALLWAAKESLEARNKALAKLGGGPKLKQAFDRAQKLGLSYTTDAGTVQLIGQADLVGLMAATLPVAGSMDGVDSASLGVNPAEFSFSWDTPAGKIVLNGNGDDEYPHGAYLLIVDTGGNDRYQAGGQTTSVTHPISLLVDLGGDDCYETKGSVSFGAGIFGFGLLLDCAGNDRYCGKTGALGFGSFGVGMLIDRAGDDHYEIRRVGQGAGVCGVGVLCDVSGSDRYSCFQEAQGFARVMGCGVLVDLSGDDVYDANDTKIDYPAAQTNKHNVSLAQGCGFGRRAHPGDGRSLAGGVGILLDAGGNDKYRCGVFGQAFSYWYGLGMLIDLAGDDAYEGAYYCQGSSTHYGVGALYDLEGSDRYVVRLNQSHGAGHDYGTGWLRDMRGDDVYESGGVGALGYGCWNGVGVFHDCAGNDQYKARRASIGQVGRARKGHLCLGIFIDEGGENQFPAKHHAKPKSTWVQPKQKNLPKAYGVGMAK